MNHYETLGVARDADHATIKRAYRRMAQMSHPDRKGGDEVLFNMVAKAWATLGDAEARSYYDQHGEDKPLDQEHAQVLQTLSQIMAAVLDASDACTDNIVQRTHDCITEGRKKAAKLRSDIEKKVRKSEQALERLTDDAGTLTELLRAILTGQRREMVNADTTLRIADKALALLAQARYRADINVPTRYAQYAPDDMERTIAAIRQGFMGAMYR